MNNTIHLVVEEGKNKGMQISIPAEGARLGRSSKNDIVLADPSLSRHHCRLFLKEGSLWVTDLGSANQTLVNNKPVQEVQLHVGDVVAVGDSMLRVVNDGTSQPEGGKAEPKGASAIDLGLMADKKKYVRTRISVWPLIVIAILIAALAAAVWIPKFLREKPVELEPIPLAEGIEKILEVNYEKVLADSENIFRYKLLIDKNNMLSVKIDDIQNNRHVRKEKPVDNQLIQEMIKSIYDSGFFDLKEEYQGIKPDVLEQWDLSITIGKKTHRTVVINRERPELFENLTDEIIEEFGKNELGLEAIQFPPEKLVEMSQNAYLHGQKLYDEREIQYGNLAAAIKSLTEAQIYLETIEPKPDFYPDILSSISDCKDELQERYENRNFSAQRAIRLRDWDVAVRELRIIMEMIPDRSDMRYKEARKSLLEVERRLEK